LAKIFFLKINIFEIVNLLSWEKTEKYKRKELKSWFGLLKNLLQIKLEEFLKNEIVYSYFWKSRLLQRILYD